MQKLLKLLFTLSTATIIPLSVTACNQQNLDHTLNIIQNGNTSYNIEDFLKNESTEATIETKTLTQEQSQVLAKSIAEKIFNNNIS